MNIGIYDPYLDTLGGGERYILSIAKYFEKDNKVTVFWDKDLTEEINNKFALDLKNINFERNIFKKGSLKDKLIKTKKYDLFFFISDGSIPFLFAKKNFLIFQFPPKNKRINLIDKIKLKNIDKLICYSNFVKKYLDNIFNLDSFVLYPPVDKILQSSKKENIILNVGRFTKGINNKKQDFLIDAFNKLEIKNWKLIIAGSYLPEDKELVDELRKKIKKSNIDIIESPSYIDLSRIYAKAKIYWHAAGAGEDTDSFPEKAEHFGMTTVEAMTTGSVPIVVNAGGQREIVEDGVSGYLWNTEEELIDKTKKVINDDNLFNKLSENAQERSLYFTSEKFYKSIESLII